MEKKNRKLSGICLGYDFVAVRTGMQWTAFCPSCNVRFIRVGVRVRILVAQPDVVGIRIYQNMKRYKYC